MELNAVGDGKTMPAKRHIVVVRDGFVGAKVERGRQRGGDFPLERISSDVAQLVADGFETLSFALSNLDRQQLEEMPVSVRCTGTGSLGPIEQSRSDVEPNRSRAWCCTC